MSALVRRVLLALLVLLGLAGSAAAQGIFLKLSTDEAKVSADRPLKVRLTAVVTRSFPAPEPEFLFDDGTGMKVRPEIKVTAVETAGGTVLPGRPHRASWEIELPNPGQYKIRARCRLRDRVVESNKLAVEVTGSATMAAQP